ncbi:ABC transporter substrate-binding protein [Rhizobium rhizogenes]|uniref:ABC transporter substrate-binding protein n=1 Tax=Rhizobium rhizogenes TaxID=359 RepID=UPI0004D5FE14|nr:ABC transporter substrate-binding protein [Rhizobium rhizogenes]KEA08271.1 peptide ABC transporter [Rhizobium rhizogenes]MQB31455.1 ABC transporter substrate-binding protein [Rhizobium rhizogenes]NTF70947.1 ABC transporter substrate-binding protein [Rhizobium rhizogenes]NTF89463.1 ABC transporter substrate-binding protein [Rhizobium rhizogenes]NTI31456.1 ABC transporter substrate-binding protein [Rhizobium rhizogenes]
MIKIGRLLLAGALLLGLALPAGAETFRWGASRDLGSLDPDSYGDSFTLGVLNHVYEGLVRYDRNLKIEPALATSWEVVSPTTWRFKLREGVKFHNGADFTAEDVQASLVRASDPKSPLKGNIPAYKGSRVIDAHTIEIDVTPNYPLLLNDLTTIYIFDAGWLKDNNTEAPTDVGSGVEGYATYHANGTGPFKIESRQPDAKTVFVKFDGWWDKPQHNIDRIEFTPIASDATRVAALLAGDIDFTDKAPVQDIPRLQASPNVKLLEGTDLRTVMIGFSQRDTLLSGAPNPMKDVRVRQAMQLAIDLDLIKKKVMRGKSRNAGTLVAPQIPGYDAALDTPLQADLEKAKALLKEAGAADFAFDFNCTDTLVNEEQICQAVASMWSRIGLKPKLDQGPRAVQTPKRSNGQVDVYTLGWATLPMLDTYSLTSQVLHTKGGTYGIFNWGGWSDSEFDRLTEASAVELDQTKRLALEAASLKVAKEHVLMIPLHQQPLTWATANKVADLPLFADNLPRLWLVKK